MARRKKYSSPEIAALADMLPPGEGRFFEHIRFALLSQLCDARRPALERADRVVQAAIDWWILDFYGHPRPALRTFLRAFVAAVGTIDDAAVADEVTRLIDEARAITSSARRESERAAERAARPPGPPGPLFRSGVAS